MKKCTARQSILFVAVLLVSLFFSSLANSQSLRKITRDEAAELRKGNNQKEQAITYTVDELRAILDQSTDGVIQFQFAKENGTFTMVIAINAAEESQSKLAKGPSIEHSDNLYNKLFAVTFFIGGRICPPPSSCLMQ